MRAAAAFYGLSALACSAFAGCADTPLLTPSKCCADTSPASWDARFVTTAGAFTLHVERSAAPLGVDRFYSMIKCGYMSNGTAGGYADGNSAAFFRVVPGFVAQFGIAGLPAISGAWQNLELQDDPVRLHNIAGSIAFATAGPNTRTTQVYINLADNLSLDTDGFAPFGNVTDGFASVVQKINSQYEQEPDQDQIYASGDAYLRASFPKLDYIISVTVM